MQIQKKREWETDFDKRVAPRLDKMETMIQSSIDVKIRHWTIQVLLKLLLLRKCSKNVSKVTTLRNITIPRITLEFRAAAEESKCNDPAAIYILKRRIATKEEVQTNVLNTVKGHNEVIGKIAHELYRKMVQLTKNFQFKPIKMYKPPKLTLRDIKSEWETLINWSKKF